MFNGLVTAVRTLSLLPIFGKDADDMASALPWFPLVGAILGALVAGFSFALGSLPNAQWPEAVGFGAVFLGVLLSRGLHLDGLADTADGFFSMAGRDKILEIMKDSCVGTFGALALILNLALKWIAMVALVKSGFYVAIVIGYIVSRTVLVELAATLPYARTEMGTGTYFVKNARPLHRVLALFFGLCLLAPFSPAGPIALLLGLGVIKLLGRYYLKKVGGVTGDLLGAACELIETGILFILAAVAGCSKGLFFFLWS